MKKLVLEKLLQKSENCGKIEDNCFCNLKHKKLPGMAGAASADIKVDGSLIPCFFKKILKP